MSRMQTRNSYRTAPTPLVSLSRPASPRRRGDRIAASATARLPKQRQTKPTRRRSRAAQAEDDRDEEEEDEDEDEEQTVDDDEQEEEDDDGLLTAEQEQIAAEEEREALHQLPLPSSASLLWSVVSFLLPLFRLVLLVSTVAVVLTVIAFSLSAAFLPWQSILASTQTVLSSMLSLLSMLLPVAASSSPSSPAAVSAHVQQHLPKAISDLSSAHPRYSSALHSSFLPALQHHFALQPPSRPLVFFVAESAALSEAEETRGVITELTHALYPTAVPGLLLDLSAQLKQPRFTGKELSAALQAFFSHREDGLLLLPSLLSLPQHQLTDIAATLQLLCDDSLAPHRRAVFVITAELEQQQMHSPQQVRAAIRQRLLQAAEDAELVDAMLSRLLRNIVIVR